MATTNQNPIDYLTLLGYVKEHDIKVYDLNQIDCKFTDSELLGNGNSMNVYGGFLKDQSGPNCKLTPVAVKIPKAEIEEINRDTKVADVRQELRMMKQFDEHPNIISLYGVVFQDLKPLILVELAERCITEYLSINKDDGAPIDWEIKARFCCEVADGLQALHAANIVHGDLKGDNILLFKDSEDRLVAKITDFGYSATEATIDGSLHFLAPECTKYAPTDIKEYKNKSLKDNYAFGLFVWQVAKDGKVPYDGMEEEDIHNLKISDTNLDELMNDLEEDTPFYFKDVIAAMTKYAPEEREALAKVREMMELDAISQASYAAAKYNLELYAKELSSDISKADLSFIESMSIPLSLKTKIYRNYEKAAASGDANAMFMMAICHSTGFAVEIDKTEALEWCIKATNAGSLNAMINITENYKINNLPIKPEVAFPWYLKTAEAGYQNAMLEVKRCYEKGYGVEKDRTEGKYWLDIWQALAHTSEIDGETSLHQAVRLGNMEAVRSLLEQNNADINTQSNDGQTVLHIAAQHGHVEVVKLLITAFGADANVENDSRKRPLELAAGRGYVEVVRLLEDETTITMLDLSDCKLSSSEIRHMAESLKMYTALTELNLGSNKIGDEGAWALAENLMQNSTLTHLYLWSSHISCDGAYALAECLKQNSTLILLELRDNNIGDKGTCALAECLTKNQALTQLDLAWNQINNVGICALADGLKQNSTLTLLNLERNNISDEGVSVLAESLKQNSALTQLNLRNNNIGVEGACALAENPTLTQLDLGGNIIGSGGAYALTECLKQNTTLTQLDLGNNNFGMEGADALAECLKQNSTLTQLNLWDNDIGDEGACALAEQLKLNSAITELDLTCNNIGDKGVLALVECLKQNTTLTELRLWRNIFSDEIKDLVKQNTILVL